MDSTRTSPTKKLEAKQASSTAGFSLIELIVVVALIALISVFAMPSITSFFQVSINTATREIASTFKESYNSALITGNVHRIVWDLKEQQFWVESGPRDALLDTKESREKEERRRRFSTKIEEGPPPSPFKMEKTVTRKKLSLPRGVVFEDVVTEQSPEPVTQGSAYTHLFPNGIAERAIIHLKDNANHRASLVLTPVLGKTDLYGRYVTEAELRQQGQ